MEQQTNPTIAPYAGAGEICPGNSQMPYPDEVEALIAPVVERIRERLGSDVIPILERHWRRLFEALSEGDGPFPQLNPVLAECWPQAY